MLLGVFNRGREAPFSCASMNQFISKSAPPTNDEQGDYVLL